jgi:hypothetical protein
MACVYRHIRLDTNMPFYVGMGESIKRAYSLSKRNKNWHDIIKATSYKVDIVFEDLNTEEASEKEKEFISIYGRLDLGTGTLCNLTNGGIGTLGRIIPEVEKNSRSISAKNMSEDTKRKMSESAKLKQITKSHMDNISDSKSIPVIDLETGIKFVSLRRACEHFNESYRKHRGRQYNNLNNIRFKRIEL